MEDASRDESSLVRSAAAGDSRAFDALMARHYGRIFRLALRMLGNREDAEDVQQETFVQAYRNLRKFRGDSSFGTWLYAIASRLCLSWRRRAAHRPEEVPIDPDIPATDAMPEEQLMAKEYAGRVSEVLDKMSPTDRLIMVLKYVEELEHEEIARILGCSPASSRSRLLRAKRLFREQYERM